VSRPAGRPFAAVEGPASDAGADALRALAVALAPHLRELLAAERRDAELVDVLAAVPGPRRTVMRACRGGRIVGAVRVGRKWLAPRASVDAWLRSLGPRAVTRPGEQGDRLDAMRARFAQGRRR
jgi:hypothetical protein